MTALGAQGKHLRVQDNDTREVVGVHVVLRQEAAPAVAVQHAKQHAGHGRGGGGVSSRSQHRRKAARRTYSLRSLSLSGDVAGLAMRCSMLRAVAACGVLGCTAATTCGTRWGSVSMSCGSPSNRVAHQELATIPHVAEVLWANVFHPREALALDPLHSTTSVPTGGMAQCDLRHAHRLQGALVSKGASVEDWILAGTQPHDRRSAVRTSARREATRHSELRSSGAPSDKRHDSFVPELCSDSHKGLGQRRSGARARARRRWCALAHQTVLPHGCHFRKCRARILRLHRM